MCGICGKISFNNNAFIDSGLILRMVSVLKHRGPDDQGVYLPKNNTEAKVKVGLGHSRLSVIDLSGSAHQPMSNENDTLWFTFNGEIYNFQELRVNLQKKGHKFKSRTDSEVIIHLYEEYGIDCVERLRGMFAFAIWDSNKSSLFLARDRAGQKPLYYSHNQGNFIFASEIKSILQDRSIIRNVNIEALHHYLTYQYIPPEETMFIGIKKLPPAHVLICQDDNIKIRRYWSLDFRRKENLSENEYCERVIELLTQATKLRLISDVPLGVFLSGGIDSSAVLSIMSGLTKGPIKTFSIGFKEKSFDELKYARHIAKVFATDHHEYIVEPNVLDVLPKLVWHFDEPFADSSAIAAYYLSSITAREVTVALSGDAGDEAFAGYDRYLANNIAYYFNAFSCLIPKQVVKGVIKKIPESTAKRNFLKRLKKFLQAIFLPQMERYIQWMAVFDNTIKKELYSTEFKERLQNIDSYNYLLSIYRDAKADNFVDATLFVDTMTYLPNDILTKVDVVSMANSLEVRSPFLDHKLLEFTASIPHTLKLRGKTTKYILKKAFKGILPKNILNRNKAGFGVPLGRWFQSELKEYIYDVLMDKKSINRGYFKQESIERILNEHVSGKIDHGHHIWSLLCLELWHHMFIDTNA